MVALVKCGAQSGPCVVTCRRSTTAAYKSINGALRRQHMGQQFAATIGFLSDALKKLRRPVDRDSGES